MLKVGQVEQVEKEGEPKRFVGTRSEGWIDRERCTPELGGKRTESSVIL